MNVFYKKLTKFGSLIRSSSRERRLDMADYFTVLLPAHPVVKNADKERPELSFNDSCPGPVRHEVSSLWARVFGDD